MSKVKLTQTRMNEIIQEEIEAVLTEDARNAGQIVAGLKSIIEQSEEHLDIIQNALVFVANENEERVQEVTKIITIYSTYIKSLQELQELVR